MLGDGKIMLLCGAFVMLFYKAWYRDRKFTRPPLTECGLCLYNNHRHLFFRFILV